MSRARPKPRTQFELAADSPIFGTVDEFLQWQPATTDTDSPTLKAIRLYQNLLAFHREDQDKTAFIDADLWRLHFAVNKSFGEDRNARYKAALKRFSNEWANHEISARALCEWAKILNSEGQALEAHKLAKRGMDAFPNSIGGRMCFNLIQQIQTKSANITTERVWNEPLPSISVSYRNVAKVYFRAVPYNFDEYIKAHRYSIESLTEEEKQQLLTAKAALEWASDLPPTADFKERTEKLPAPKNLKPGFYFLLASHDPSFEKSNNRVSFTQVWVSDLALVMRTRNMENGIEGFVLNAVTGEPVSGATVRVWTRNRSGGGFQPSAAARSDGNGLFRFNRQNESAIFLAEHGAQRLATSREYFTGKTQPEPAPHTRTVFFTDRSLYRPGQTIQYKGICLRVDQTGNQYKTLAGQVLTVLFHDPNRKEIARQQLKTNDYGAFSGSFSAPRDRLTGRMTIEVQGGPSGSTSFNVEEYKRPKFQVELKTPKEAAKLNGEVSLPGKATAYTGAAIGGAKVKYRVVREVRFPSWCWWSWRSFPPGRDQGQAIAHGTAVTETDGSFTVKFVAKADPSAREKDEPTFEFTVHADVTDTTGETRSTQRSVRVGYTALQASLAANEWQTSDKPAEITVVSKTLDGEGQAVDGTVKVYALKQPTTVQRPEMQAGYQSARLGSVMDRTGGAQGKPDWSNPNSWELAQVVSEQAFQTDASGVTKVTVAT